MYFKNRLFWIAAIIGLLLDRATKFWIVQNFYLSESWPLFPGVFHLTYVINPGAAFSFFKDGGWWLRWLSLAVSAGLMTWAWLQTFINRWQQLGYGFILGGALGNGIDRFASGSVIDFLEFRLIRFPVFNFADIFINVGIVCLLIGSFDLPSLTSKRRKN